MSAYLRLELMGLVMSQPLEGRPTPEQNPMLYKTLVALDMKDIVTKGKDQLRERYHATVQSLQGHLDYFASLNMKCNEALNVYLSELLSDYHNGCREPTKSVSISICGFGNKAGVRDKDDAIVAWINEGNGLINDLTKVEESFDFTMYCFTLHSLMYVEKILEILDVFTTSYQGMILGVEEYAPVDQNFLDPIPTPDFVTGNCSGEADCTCGCQLDHPTLIIEGLEDLLNGKSSHAARYTEGVCAARSDSFILVTGNEGEIFDKIKDLGKKALDAIMDSFEAIKDSFDPSDEKEYADQVGEIAENNKKALQNITNKGLTINEAAKEGIIALAKSTDESGEMGKVVAKLTTVSTAAGVIDGLLGLLQKEATSSSEVSKKFKDTEKAIADLKKASSETPKGSEDNKEAVSLAKEGVNLKIKEAKDSLKELRKELKVYKAKMGGLKKAISGISPHIFPNPDKKEDNKE